MAYAPRQFHFIDSSIFMSLIKDDEFSKKCESYVIRLGKNIFKGYTSVTVFGEVLLSIHNKIRLKSEQNRALQDFFKILSDMNIDPTKEGHDRDIITPPNNILRDMIPKVNWLEKIIYPTDTHLLAESLALEKTLKSQNPSIDFRFATIDGRIPVYDDYLRVSRGSKKILKIFRVDRMR